MTGAALDFDAENHWTASFLAVVAPSFFGSVNSSTPSVYLAMALVSSTSFARVKLRDTLP